MVYTAPGKCLIAWDMGQGPTFDAAARRKTLGECQVWRSVDPVNTGSAAVCIGTTKAEAFLDADVQDGGCYYYWVMSELEGGGLHQVGPTYDVEMPSSWPEPYGVAPTEPEDLAATGASNGIRLRWVVSVDGDDEQAGRSGLVAYFVYDSNQDAPDSVVWVDEDNIIVDEYGQIVSGVTDNFTDVLPAGTRKSYQVRALNRNLNLSQPSAIVTGRAGARIYASGWTYVTDDTYGAYVWTSLTPMFRFFDADDNVIQSAGTSLSPWNGRHVDYFQRHAGYRDVPEGAVKVAPGWNFLGLPAPNGALYLTKFMLSDASLSIPIAFSSVGNPTTITTEYDHDFEEGDLIAIIGHVGASSSPALINREHVISWISPTKFTVPCNVTVDGTGGEAVRLREYGDGDDDGWEWDGAAHNSASREAAGDAHNLCHNPRLHVSTSGWLPSEHVTLSRVTATEVAMPPWVDACLQVEVDQVAVVSFYGDAQALATLL